MIAILATISVVAYNGVQDRANDSAVQSDINNFAKKIMLYHAEFGEYPTGSYSSLPVGIEDDISLAQNAYSTDVSNFYYCEGTVSGRAVFAVGAVSKSNNKFYYLSSNGGVQPYTGGVGGLVLWCTGMIPDVEEGYTRSFGFAAPTQTWHPWTN